MGVARIVVSRYRGQAGQLQLPRLDCLADESLQFAYQAYVSAMFSYAPQVFSDLAQSAATLPISTLLTREPALYKLIQRSTRLATFDLLLVGPANSLRGRMELAGFSSEVSATILELQLVSLETCLHKLEALQLVPTLLEDLLALYDPALHPMRRARYIIPSTAAI